MFIHFGSHIDKSEAHSTVRNLADGGVNGFEVAQTWRNLVKYYSELKLSTASDRLLAIGAFAEQVHSKKARGSIPRGFGETRCTETYFG